MNFSICPIIVLSDFRKGQVHAIKITMCSSEDWTAVPLRGKQSQKMVIYGSLPVHVPENKLKLEKK